MKGVFECVGLDMGKAGKGAGLRVLVLSPYAYFRGKKGFEKNNSGFAYAVSDTCRALARFGDQVYLITQSAITSGFKINGIAVPAKRWADVLLHARAKDVWTGIKALKGYDAGWTAKLKVLYYFLNTGYVLKIVKKVDPDVVHIQSIGFYTIPFLIAAVTCGKPFVVSNHGLATFLGPGMVDEKQREMEGAFFRLASRYGVPVTTVSSGIKKRITKHLHIKGDNITVVFNSCGLDMKKLDENKQRLIKKKFGIDADSQTFLCVGSISSRKNQIQVARAYRLLDGPARNKVKVLFAGSGPKEQELREYIKKHGLGQNLFACGNIGHDELVNYYRIADYTVMASVDEGFGLPVVEGYAFGLPAVAFSDLDAVADIGGRESMVMVAQRSDAALAEGLLAAMEKDWDRGVIKEMALKFSRKEMALRYHQVLASCRKDGARLPLQDVINLI